MKLNSRPHLARDVRKSGVKEKIVSIHKWLKMVRHGINSSSKWNCKIWIWYLKPFTIGFINCRANLFLEHPIKNESHLMLFLKLTTYQWPIFDWNYWCVIAGKFQTECFVSIENDRMYISILKKILHQSYALEFLVNHMSFRIKEF